MKKLTVYAISETPNEAMAWVERGHFTMHDPRRTDPNPNLKNKVWEVEIEINAISALKKAPR